MPVDDLAEPGSVPPYEDPERLLRDRGRGGSEAPRARVSRYPGAVPVFYLPRAGRVSRPGTRVPFTWDLGRDAGGMETEVTWREEAACRSPDVDPEWFFASPKDPALTKAKWVCKRCPVRDECLADARGTRYGVWGGLDSQERLSPGDPATPESRAWPFRQEDAI